MTAAIKEPAVVEAVADEALVLSEVLDLRAAKPLLHVLLDRRGGDLDIDASSVGRLGGLCLQVLLSAVSTWAADGHALRFVNPSDAFLEGATLLGAERALRT